MEEVVVGKDDQENQKPKTNSPEKVQQKNSHESDLKMIVFVIQ